MQWQPGFFDVEQRAAKLREMGELLVGLNAEIDWEAFRPGLNRVYEKVRKGNAGAKPFVQGAGAATTEQISPMIGSDTRSVIAFPSCVS